MRFDGRVHEVIATIESGVIAPSRFSLRSERTRDRTEAALTRSSSGPKGATFFESSLPTSPLTREVDNHDDVSVSHLSEGRCVSQISKLVVGKIRSSGSIVRSALI